MCKRVSECIVMMQNSRFAWPQGLLLLTIFILKVRQDFLINVLINWLSLRYNLKMHQALVVKKINQHDLGI